jgi:hypothetical protein
MVIRYNTTRWHFLMFFVVVLSLSCQHSPSVTGKWQEIGKAGTLEFNDDNTFDAVDDMGMPVNGVYHLDDSGNMRLEIKHHESPPEIINLRIKMARSYPSSSPRPVVFSVHELPTVKRVEVQGEKPH